MRRRTRLTLVAVLVLMLVATAAAFMTANGSGAGAGGSSASHDDVTITPGTPSAELYPGGTSDVAIHLSNPNPSPVKVASLELDDSQGDGGFDVPSGCDASVLSFTPQDNGGTGFTVPASGGVDADLAGALTMGTAAADACQGAAITVYLKAGS